MFENFQQFVLRKEELEKKLSQNLWSGNDEFVKITKEYNRVNALVNLKSEYDSILKKLADNEALLQSHSTDPEFDELIREDSRVLKEQSALTEKKIIRMLLPPDKNEGRPVIIEIRAGTGGDEASLFAGEIYRMYQRYSETIGLGLEVMSVSASEMGGIKEVIFSIKGEAAWRQFKYEAGTHRVQRVPVTESCGRVHTSAITVSVLPEPEDVEININPKELRIDIFRSSGPGGQGVNTTDSAVRITHLPTGIAIQCQDERSQHKNKAKAMRILNARLLDIRQREESEKRSQNRKQQVGSGDRSEKIRTYNFPQNRLTDHRINLTLYNLAEIIEGKMEDLLFALAEAEYKMMLEKAVQTPEIG